MEEDWTNNDKVKKIKVLHNLTMKNEYKIKRMKIKKNV